MRNIFTILALIYLASINICADSVNVFYENINGFNVKYISVDTSDPEVVITTALSQRFPDGLESWGSFMSRLNPDAAINGTYFCPRTCKPVGDIVVENQHYYRGVAGTAFCVLPGNKMTMRLGPNQAKANWKDCQTVVCAGPRLLTEGSVTIAARDEGFRDPRVLGSAPRSAIAWDKNGTLFFLTIDQNISLSNLAYVCKKLGASSAMAMDGGNSSGLYAEGRTLSWPGRSLANVLCIYKTRQKFYKYAYGLAPNLTVKYPIGFSKPQPVYISNPSLLTALGNFAAGRPVNYDQPKSLSEMYNKSEDVQAPEIFTNNYNQVTEVKSEVPLQPVVTIKQVPVIKQTTEMKPPKFNPNTPIPEIKNEPVIIPKTVEKTIEVKIDEVPEIDVDPIAAPVEVENVNIDTRPPLTTENKLPEIDVRMTAPKVKIVKLEAADDTGFARGTYTLHVNVDPNSEVHLVKLFIDGVLRDMKSNQSFTKYWNTREYTNTLHTIEVVAITNNQIVSKDILRIQVDN
ncbi:MAG: phosphodiester glycosidase family protein [bacterium]